MIRATLESLDAMLGQALSRLRGGAHSQVAAHAAAHLAAEIAAARALFEQDGESEAASTYVSDLARSLRGGVDLGCGERVALEALAIADVPATGLPMPDYAGVAAAVRRGASHPVFRGEALDAMRSEIRRFVEREVAPIARRIHDEDALIPAALVRQLGELGVFGLTTAREHGGSGLGRVTMCAVTEELTRGSLAVASLATRSEIAADLIASSGTEEQKRAWLPGIAAGDVLPTAAFTEPDHGSDLAHVRTRARLDEGAYVVHGQKTWTTHAARADLMTLLVRTSSDEGHAGLSLLLAPKTRREEPPDFVDPGLSGTEIPVLGYRGMKEYTLHFDGFRVARTALLGTEEGRGFKQLMATFETARIQTAARAVGVAQSALELAVRYASERVQFGRTLFDFGRTAHKIGRMACRVRAARALTFDAARRKDTGGRCDLEAGMAKLVATRTAWEAADACVQIHGGYGYATECDASRVLLDARVLSLFEGTSEIQAEVIARRLLG